MSRRSQRALAVVTGAGAVTASLGASLVGLAAPADAVTSHTATPACDANPAHAATDNAAIATYNKAQLASYVNAAAPRTNYDAALLAYNAVKTKPAYTGDAKLKAYNVADAAVQKAIAQHKPAATIAKLRGARAAKAAPVLAAGNQRSTAIAKAYVRTKQAYDTVNKAKYDAALTTLNAKRRALTVTTFLSDRTSSPLAVDTTPATPLVAFNAVLDTTQGVGGTLGETWRWGDYFTRINVQAGVVVSVCTFVDELRVGSVSQNGTTVDLSQPDSTVVHTRDEANAVPSPNTVGSLKASSASIQSQVLDVLAPAIVGTKADAANHKSASQVARNLMTTTIQSFDPTYSTLDANIGAGSGQSYTIEGFTRSLQNALIKARL